MDDGVEFSFVTKSFVALIVAIYLIQLEMLYDEENFGIQII